MSARTPLHSKILASHVGLEAEGLTAAEGVARVSRACLTGWGEAWPREEVPRPPNPVSDTPTTRLGPTAGPPVHAHSQERGTTAPLSLRAGSVGHSDQVIAGKHTWGGGGESPWLQKKGKSQAFAICQTEPTPARLTQHQPTSPASEPPTGSDAWFCFGG